MAKHTISADVVTNLPSSVPINESAYSTRCLTAKAELSKSSGNAMVVLEVEIYNPSKIVSDYNGQTYSVAGIKDTMYLSMSDKAIGRTLEFMQQIGLPAEIDDDISNTNTQQFVGRTWSALWGNEANPATKPLTEADRAAGKKVGEQIYQEDGVTPIVYNRPKHKRVLGLTKAQAPAA